MSEIAERFPGGVRPLARPATSDPGDGIEPLDDLGKRVAEALRQAAERAPGGTMVVATTTAARPGRASAACSAGPRSAAHHRVAGQLPLERARPLRGQGLAARRPQPLRLIAFVAATPQELVSARPLDTSPCGVAAFARPWKGRDPWRIAPIAGRGSGSRRALPLAGIGWWTGGQ